MPASLASRFVLGGVRVRQRGCEAGDGGFEIGGIGLFQLQQIGQFGDLGIEAREGGVLAEDLLTEEELGQNEDRQAGT